MIRVGVVGYGFAGRSFHSYLIPLAEGLRLSAIVTGNPERQTAAASERQVPVYATMTEMIEAEHPDLVVIATPHDTHAELAIQAMESGRHVVVDKVMCMNVAEADAMIAASRANNVLLSVFHNRRWDWDFLTVKKIMGDGLLGTPYMIESGVYRYRAARGWRSSLSRSGGLLFDWGAHLIDQALLLIPSHPVSVFCDRQKHRWDGDTEDHVKCLIRFENGFLFTAEVGNLSRIGRPRWTVYGTLGALIKEGLDPQEPAMIRGHIDQAEEPPGHRARVVTEINGTVVEMTIESVRGSWTAFYQNISDALRHGTELAVKPEQARAVMAVLDAAGHSVKTGQAVPVQQ